MSLFKGLMMFQVGRVGWGESLWMNTSTFEGSLAVLEDMATKRVALSPLPTTLVGLRVTNPEVRRASRVSALRLQGTFQAKRGMLLDFYSLLVRFVCDGYHTNYHLGGVPKGMNLQEKFNPTTKWQKLFQTYADAIKRHCVMVNLRHLRRGEERPAGTTDTVINPIREVTLVRIVLKRRGNGPNYLPRGRARNRKPTP